MRGNCEEDGEGEEEEPGVESRRHWRGEGECGGNDIRVQRRCDRRVVGSGGDSEGGDRGGIGGEARYSESVDEVTDEVVRICAFEVVVLPGFVRG